MARRGGRLQGDPDEELAPGSTLGGRYRIERKIGRGGMGTVYSAQHLMLGIKVGLKVIAQRHTTDPRQLERFRREARVAAQLKHPNVVDIIDLGEADGHEYIAMEFLEGMDLCDAIHLSSTYEPTDMVPIVDQILQALEVAHGAGLVHRDLKPENVYLAQQPSGELRVKLLDFGVVKVPPEGEGAELQLTRTGTVVGTPEYMAPEQALGTAVDSRADLYALGCIAHAMVCGRPPFVGKSVMLLMAAHVKEQPKRPSELRPNLRAGGAVDAFIGKALEKDPRRRYNSASEMREALGELEREIGEANLKRRQITMPSQRGGTPPDMLGPPTDTDPRRRPGDLASTPQPDTSPVHKVSPPQSPATPTDVLERKRPRPWLWLFAGMLLGGATATAATWWILRR